MFPDILIVSVPSKHARTELSLDYVHFDLQLSKFMPWNNRLGNSKILRLIKFQIQALCHFFQQKNSLSVKTISNLNSESHHLKAKTTRDAFKPGFCLNLSDTELVFLCILECLFWSSFSPVSISLASSTFGQMHYVCFCWPIQPIWMNLFRS